LRNGYVRPCRCCAAEQRDKFAAFHCPVRRVVTVRSGHRSFRMGWSGKAEAGSIGLQKQGRHEQLGTSSDAYKRREKRLGIYL
jgi:hypothetical protein